MTINVDEIREELRALWAAANGCKPCASSALQELGGYATCSRTADAVGALFASEHGGDGSIYGYPRGEDYGLAEAMIAEYCGLTKEEAS